MSLEPRLPLRLQAVRTKTLGLLAACVAFVAAGLFVRGVHPVAGYSAIAFFGLGALVALVDLLPGSSYLLVEEKGLTICSSFRKTFHPWTDLAEFLPVSVGTMTLVGIRYTDRYKGQAATRRLAARLGGVEGALPQTYGLAVEALASLLNVVRTRQSGEF